MDMIISPDMDSAWLTLKQFCAIFNLTINTGLTRDKNHYASIRGLDIQRDCVAEGAVGFGTTRKEALAELAKKLSSGPIVGRNYNGPKWTIEVRP
jgi:hypothetical protein